MKRIIAVILSLIMVISVTFSYAAAEPVAEVYSDSFSYSPSGIYDGESVKQKFADFSKLSNDDLRTNVKNTFASQIKAVDIFVKNAFSLEDIYGFQFDISLNVNEAIIAYVDTNLQSGNKIGYSLWGAYFNHQNEAFNKGIYLSYGKAKATSDANIKANMREDGSIKIATMYLVIGNDCVDDIEISYSLTDVAAKNSEGVLSIAKDFKKSTKTVGTLDFNIEDPSVSILGAQIRASGKQGLRFGASIIKDNAFNGLKDVSYGVLIGVEKHLENYGMLELNNKEENVINCENMILEETDEKIVFCGKISGFPKKGTYDSVDFVARAYIKFKRANSKKFEIIYSDCIVRNVDQIKTQIGMK